MRHLSQGVYQWNLEWNTDLTNRLLVLVSHVPLMEGQLAHGGEVQVRVHPVQCQPRAPRLQGDHVHVATVDHLEGADVGASRREAEWGPFFILRLFCIFYKSHVDDADLIERLLHHKHLLIKILFRL